MSDEHDYVKIWFALDQDENGWPPASSEGLWAVRLSAQVVRLDNTPWFVRNVACGDVFAVERDDQGQWWAGERLRWSGHCTIRVVPFRDGALAGSLRDVLDRFSPLGVSGEGIEQFGMVALDVPPTADIAMVRLRLVEGEDAGWWEYEEGCVSDAWLALS
ncbi:hypothetical protein Cs7R123_48010 [Catellatospora sp. TT07R-123]|uniref:DUF4265 domain-containing protein n=1 Tax=Catellatospora sp. TT07R-123 TaxID=2733863 RepID=UPI001B13E101|nr:DUF4265 domain-containing protein [Catellatospora sp. TT07R-123]GHJ47459.1 hypothetical protein Cs7R123_48010 [Catellatospora sp. TT07R-123]